MDTYETPTPDATGHAEEPSKDRPLAVLRDWGPWFLAIGPAVAFLLGFSYERGFALARGLPTDLITVRPESIAWGIGALVFVGFMGDGAVKLALALAPRAEKHPAARELVTSAMAGALAGVLLFVHGEDPSQPIALFLVALNSLMLALFNLKMATWWRANNPDGRPPPTSRLTSGLFAAYHGLSTRAVPFVILALLTSGLVSWRGNADALKEETFLSYTDDATGEMVVLRSYGDFAIAAELDRDAKTIGPGYKVIAMDDLESGATREWLGKLTTAEAVGTPDD